MSGEYFECGEHGWSYEPQDSCPVCDGVKLEHERIVTLLTQRLSGKFTHEDYTIEYLIALIKGETE